MPTFNVISASTKSTVVMLILTCTSLALAANASVRVRGCSYNVHAYELSEIRNDYYFQNDLEMHKVNQNLYRGSVPLMGGYRLGIEASLIGQSLQIKSLIHAGSSIVMQIKGSGRLPVKGQSKSFLLSARSLRPIDDMGPSIKTVFETANVRCTVGPTRLSDRVIDLIQ